MAGVNPTNLRAVSIEANKFGSSLLNGEQKPGFYFTCVEGERFVTPCESGDVALPISVEKWSNAFKVAAFFSGYSTYRCFRRMSRSFSCSIIFQELLIYS